MKFSIKKEILEKKLAIASRFCLTSLSSIQSLTGGLIKLDNQYLEITTTNLNDYFSTKIKVEGEKDGSAVVDIKKIGEFLNFLPQGKINIELKDSKLILKQGRTKGTFNTIPGQDFPELPKEVDNKITFKKSFLKKNLPLIIASSARDAARPILTGINIVSREGETFIVSTDGFRLSLITQETRQKIPSIVISASILDEVLKLLDEESELEIKYSEKEKIVKFDLQDIHIYSRLIDGEFPPFEKVIPTDSSTRLKLDREEFIKNIKLASVFARDFSSVILLEIRKDGLYIRPKTTEKEGTVVFQEMDFEGDEQTIAFNYKFILDFLNNVKGEKIIFEMTGGNAPGVFRSEDNPKFIHIIMPIRTEEEKA